MNSFGHRPDVQAATALQDATSFPLTPTQLGMIYESVLADRPWINLEQVVVHMPDEPADADAMRAAWSDLCARHEPLRTVFDWHGREEPVQRALPKAEIDFHEFDWTDRDAADREAALRGWLAKDRVRGVDLTRAPNWRLTWFRIGPRHAILVWTFHHALLDGRSFTALLREALDAYEARVASGAMPDPGPPPPRFADHCRAVRSQDLSAAEHHFRSALDAFDGPNKIDLGAPDTRPSDGRKRLLDARLPASTGRALQARAKATDSSIATLVMTAWGLVTARCSGRKEAVFGTTRSGRYLLPSARDMAGCLITTIPARLTVDGEATIDKTIARFRGDQFAARPFEHTPLGDIAAWAGLPGGTTLFDSAVIFERGSVDGILRALGGAWTRRRIEVLEEGALPLTLAVYADPEILVRLEYDPAIHTPEVGQRLLDYTCRALDALASLPGDTPLAQIDMLPTGERDDVLRLAAPTGRHAPARGTVLDRFRRASEAMASRPALRQAGIPGQLSLSELNVRSDALAQELAARSVGPGAVVALMLPRSTDFVVAMLAVLKSGAAFLPVDPAYPAQAVAHILEDADPRLVLVADAARAPDLAVDRLPVRPLSHPRTSPATALPGPEPDDLAYLVYTSGSTGKPKGVMIPHGALTEHVAAITEAFALCPEDRVLQFASLSFDVSIEEILPTLASGAQLVLRSEAMAESPGAFLEETARHGLTVLNLPTAFWHALVDHMQATGARLPGSVRLVIAGGEAIAPGALRKFRQMQPGLRFLNGYGPTEATITATLFDPDASTALRAGESVPIGRPLPHCRAYVAALDGSLAPRGVLGELWLAGPCLARGYLRKARLTATRFRPDPFAGDAKARAYRTGDLVRWRADGTLAFAGRADRQVKVNGFRIEPREVESVLEALPGVSLALVAADRAGDRDSRLLCWVTPENPADPPDPNDLRRAVAERLPKHMVPAVTVVAGFPKTPGGKIDLDALPRPAPPRPARVATLETDATVRQIMAIFAGVLGATPPDADASFFDIGGHSLLAVRLIGAIEAQFGHRLSIAALHAGPSPRQIAAAVSAPGAAAATPRYIVPIQPEGQRPPIYGVHVLGTNEAFYRPLAACLGPDQPLFGLTVGALTEGVPTGVRDTAAAYCADIKRFHPDGPVCLTAVSLGSFIAFELAQQLRAAGRDVQMLAFFDAAGPGGRAMVGPSKRVGLHLRQLARKGPGYLGKIARNRYEGLRNGLERARLRRLQRNGATAPVAANVDTIVAANTLAADAYRPAPYAGRLTVFRASRNLFDAPEAIEDGLGWAGVAAGGLDLIDVPGGHLTMLAQPHVETLAHHLRRIIDGAASKKGSAAR